MLDSLKLVYYYEMFSCEHCEVVMFFNKLSVQFSCITDVLVYLSEGTKLQGQTLMPIYYQINVVLFFWFFHNYFFPEAYSRIQELGTACIYMYVYNQVLD